LKVVFIVNGISKTSIPWRWATFFNQHSSILKVEVLSVKNHKKKFLEVAKVTDIIHGHHVKSMTLFLIINIFYRKKNIYTVHGSYLFLSKINAFLLKFIFRYSGRIIFVNKLLYDILPPNMKELIENKYEIILNGVEINYHYKKMDVYKKFNIDTQDIVLFHPARFVQEKNHLHLLDALKLAVGKNSKIKLLLAGDGSLREDIEQRIGELELEEHVLLLGLIERDEVYNFLERCDLFLMPSLSEGLNIAFLEALSMHCRVLVSDIEQFVYPLEVNGLDPNDLNVTFVNPEDKKSIAVGILSALEKRKRTDYNCSDFSLETMMHKYERTYMDLL